MNAKPSARASLSQRDRRIIEHVGRYRLTTIDVLCRAVTPGVSAAALSKVVRRLCSQQMLTRHQLLHPTCYFVLGSAGASLLGMSKVRTRPLGPQSLPMEYGLLLHAVLGQTRRRRLTNDELKQLCPWLTGPLLDSPHCLDEKQQTLELVRVDLGGAADHIARKVRRDIMQRRQLLFFDNFVGESRFRLVIITSSREKSAAIRQALDRHDWPRGLAIHLAVVPQLLPLTTGAENAS